MVEPVELLRAEQITEQPISTTEEQPTPTAEQPSTTNQPPQLNSKELPSMPPPTSQDEGYGHGVSTDSMIVTPCVPMLGERSTNVGTKEVTTPNEALAQQTEFDQTAHLDDKLLFWKRAAMMIVSAIVPIEKDFMDLELE